MSEQYFTVNIRAYLDKDKPTYIGEDSLYELNFYSPESYVLCSKGLLCVAVNATYCVNSNPFSSTNHTQILH